MKSDTFASVPMRMVGPINLASDLISGEIFVPLATYESPLWPSVARGAKISKQVPAGITAVLVSSCMTRSILFESSDACQAAKISQEIYALEDTLAAKVASQSRFAKLKSMHIEIVGKLLYVRLSFSTGEASGHNMATKAAQAIMDFLLAQLTLTYVSISANICCDKKPAAINGILGRGKYVVADIKIARHICERYLRATPEQIHNLNIKKNLLGTNIAGAVRTANAHFANMLLAIYLATGQDAANIVEGSQGFVTTDIVDDHLYFSVTLPNLIIGTVGNGKELAFVQENLQSMGCLGAEGADKLAIITAATVLCGELSLLAAQTNPGELLRTHMLMERRPQNVKV